MMAPSEDIREASHGGTRPPWRGRSALPVRLAIDLKFLNRAAFYQAGSAASGFPLRHGAERDRISRRLDRGNAVLPHVARGAGHHVKRTRRGIEGEAMPFIAGAPAKPELARRAQRQPEYLAEMRLVAVPADADAGVVFGAQ